MVLIEYLLRLPRRVSVALLPYLSILNLQRRLEMRLLNRWLEDLGGYRVLDVGCGHGLYTLKLAWAGASLVGIDVSEEALSLAQRMTSKVGFDKGSAYVVGSATELPARDRSFDVIVCNSVLEHITADELALREMRRVLKANGFLFLTVDCDERGLALSWVERLPRWTRRLLLKAPVASAYTFREGLLGYLDDRYRVVHRYSAEALRSRLERLGFQVVNRSYYLVGLGGAIYEATNAFRGLDMERGLGRIVYMFVSVVTYPLVLLGEGGGAKGHGLALLAVKKARK